MAPAEQRVLGNVGALVHVKRRHPEQIICLCGCMAQEPHVARKVQRPTGRWTWYSAPTCCGGSPSSSTPC